MAATKNNTFENLNEFRKQNLFCDVTLDVNGKLFSCHRLVLIAASNYFRVMFNGNFKESADSSTIAIKEIDSESMELLLEAMYTTRLNLLAKNVYAILKASNFLQIDVIFDRCVEYITNNPSHIHYLIEICLFADTLGIQNLYDKCIVAIADNVLRYGKTDAFLQLSFDVVKLILSKVNLKFHDDEIIELIIKWCKSNHATSQNIRMLLQAPTLTSPVTGIAALVKVISTGNSFAKDEVCGESSKDEVKSYSILKINVYLNTADTKTGGAGWGTVKLNDSFDKYTLSNYEPTDSNFLRICSSGNKVYCLERDIYSEKCSFSCYEDNVKIELRVPTHLDWKVNDFECQMIAMKDFIYTLDRYKICGYSPEQCSVVRETRIPSKLLSCYPDFFSLASLDDILYVVGYQHNYKNVLFWYDHRSWTFDYREYPSMVHHERAAVCAFDRCLAISGSSHGNTLHNTFSIFDLTANKWRTDVKPMNYGRANHKLVHIDGFIYAIENRPFLEKYNVNLDEWIEISSLPETIQFVDHNDVQLNIATNSVLYANTVPV